MSKKRQNEVLVKGSISLLKQAIIRVLNSSTFREELDRLVEESNRDEMINKMKKLALAFAAKLQAEFPILYILVFLWKRVWIRVPIWVGRIYHLSRNQ